MINLYARLIINSAKTPTPTYTLANVPEKDRVAVVALLLVWGYDQEGKKVAA